MFLREVPSLQAPRCCDGWLCAAVASWPLVPIQVVLTAFPDKSRHRHFYKCLFINLFDRWGQWLLLSKVWDLGALVELSCRSLCGCYFRRVQRRTWSGVQSHNPSLMRGEASAVMKRGNGSTCAEGLPCVAVLSPVLVPSVVWTQISPGLEFKVMFNHFAYWSSQLMSNLG